VKALKDVAIILLPMLVILLIVILFPDLIMFLPRMLMSKFL
jgi:TRAP-type C4-dicarboxylate transport system permease large subunit